MAEIDHLGIAVKSLAAAKKFYEKLGMQVVGEEVVEHERVRVAMVPVGESRIELLEPTAEDSPVGRFIAKRGEGIHHIAIEVDDIAAELARLRSEGIQLIDEVPRQGAHNMQIAFLHPKSTNGVLVELCQRK